MSLKKTSEHKEGQSKRPRLESQKSLTNVEYIFKGFHIYIFPTGIGSIRAKIFHNHVNKLGGCVDDKISEKTTHVIVEEGISYEKIQKVLGLKQFPFNTKIVKTMWLSSCISKNCLLDTEEFEIKISRSNSQELHVNDTKASTTSFVTSSEKSVSQTGNLEVSPKFVCSIPSTSASFNPNKYITDKLEVLAQMYKNTRDHWRAIGYEKAIVALKQHPKPITSWEEAKSLPGVGDRLAYKIYEIVQSGQLRKIEETCTGGKVAAINLFTKVWGIGPSSAESFVEQGFYTLNDLATKAQLTRAQSIGLKYFQELQERMPRSEAYEIFCLVEEQVKTLDPQLNCEICGSYKRNRETCGDIDVLITHPDGKSHKGVLPKLVTLLHDIGLLTDDLVSQEENGGQKKYMGICQLSAHNNIHRRIDIIVVPFEEYSCAIMHFTGSAHFNRSIRLLASRKNMSLSEHCLKAEIIRQVTAFREIGCSDNYHLVTNVLKRMITKNLAERFSWAGAKKKRTFKSLKLTAVLQEAVRANNNNITEEQIASIAGNWLRHAKRRREREEKRNGGDQLLLAE